MSDIKRVGPQRYTSASREKPTCSKTGSEQMASSVEIFTHLVARVRPAVANIAAAPREREHESTYFGGEWMLLPITSRVQPKNLPCRAACNQRVQHGLNRRRPDSRTEQYHRALSRLENEASARRADIEYIAHPDMVAQVSSTGPVRLNLHADSIALR